MQNYSPADKPTLYFIGVTTARSSIMRVFPRWVDVLNLGGVEIRGIDLPLHAPKRDYRRIAKFLKEDPLSLGALVTTHKLDLYDACEDLFDYVDPYATKLREVSCISKRGSKFRAHAKDPISSGLAIEHFVPEDFWLDHNGEALLIGAGGSSLAMALYFAHKKHRDNKPKRVIIANRSIPRLESAKYTLADLDLNLSFVHGPDPKDNDILINQLPPYSLIVNATGLGKDAPGSPITDASLFPPNSFVWEINYRGELIFMQQALAQARERHLYVEDGWVYFIHGWTQVISEVFEVNIDEKQLKNLSEVAKNA